MTYEQYEREYTKLWDRFYKSDTKVLDIWVEMAKHASNEYLHFVKDNDFNKRYIEINLKELNNRIAERILLEN